MRSCLVQGDIKIEFLETRLKGTVMNIRTKPRIAIAATTVALAAVMFASTTSASSRWQADGCWGSSVTGATGVATNTDKAKQRARGNWQSAIRRLGLHKQKPRAQMWNYARGNKYACRRKRGVSRCNAKAVPCGIREVD